eukprot:319845_1
MGGSKNETSANKKVNPELAPLITDTVAKGNQGYGDVEAQQNSQGVGGIGHNGGNLSRDKGRAGQIMVDGGDVMCLSYSWKAALNGGVDGLLLGFSIVAGGEGSGLAHHTVAIIGICCVIANGLSAGVGEYLCSKAQSSFLKQEKTRLQWELGSNRDCMVTSVAESYAWKGLGMAESTAVADILGKSDAALMDAVASHEGIGSLSGVDLFSYTWTESKSVLEGFSLLIGYVILGIIPLIIYCGIPSLSSWASVKLNSGCSIQFVISAVAAGICFFILGACRSYWTNRGWFLSGLETCLIGLCCSGCAFEIGELLTYIHNGPFHC